MIFSYNWLKEFVDIADIDPHELSERLTMCGVEVESVTGAEGKLDNVFSAKLKTVEKHPNADRLKLCEVHLKGEAYSIVCGADNMKEGDMVVLSLPGTILPNGLNIKKSKIRGVESRGMLCSEAELGLSVSSEGIMILPPDTAEGALIKTLLGLDDYRLDVGITPNRGDLFSIRGMAREISAITGTRLKEPSLSVSYGEASVEEVVKVRVVDQERCPRYMAGAVRGVTVAPSPTWLAARLEAHGIRAINNVVDATNYVLLEYGQPLHAFDAAKLKGGMIVVRGAKKNEPITTLDGLERTVDEGTLLICDSESPQAIAGVMGGAGSEVTDETRNIILESAFFEPTSVRRSSKRLSLSSESSFRFERGVDIEAVETALERALGLISELAGGEILNGPIDVYSKRWIPVKIALRPERATKILGTKISAEEATELLARLGMEVEGSDDVLNVSVPPHRLDITREEDLIEEIARLVGYERVPTTLPTTTLSLGNTSEEHKLKKIIKNIFICSGLYEVINYSFVSEEAFSMTGDPSRNCVKILNPLSEEQSVMRDSLIPSLITTLKKNQAVRNDEVRIFEIAPAFSPSKGKGGVKERWLVSALMSGARTGERWDEKPQKTDFYDIKGLIEAIFSSLSPAATRPDYIPRELPWLHPGRSASVILDGVEIGVIGELHPDERERAGLRDEVSLLELDFTTLFGIYTRDRSYQRLPKFPGSERDIAFVLDNKFPYGDILSSIKRLDKKLIEKVELFDVYYDKNFKECSRSLAIRITYRHSDKTLTHDEVESVHTNVLEELKKRFDAKIRS